MKSREPPRVPHFGDVEGREPPDASGSKSLKSLTAKFIQMLTQASWRGELVSLNEAAQQLSVVKRRLYDATNVLQVMGVIKKHQRNYYSLSKDYMLLQQLEAQEEEVATFDHAIHALERENQKLIKQEQHQEGLLFLQEQDLKDLQHSQGEAIIGLKPTEDAIVEFTGPRETSFFRPNGQGIHIQKYLPRRQPRDE